MKNEHPLKGGTASNPLIVSLMRKYLSTLPLLSGLFVYDHHSRVQGSVGSSLPHRANSQPIGTELVADSAQDLGSLKLIEMHIALHRTHLHSVQAETKKKEKKKN